MPNPESESQSPKFKDVEQLDRFLRQINVALRVSELLDRAFVLDKSGPAPSYESEKAAESDLIMPIQTEFGVRMSIRIPVVGEPRLESTNSEDYRSLIQQLLKRVHNFR